MKVVTIAMLLGMLFPAVLSAQDAGNRGTDEAVPSGVTAQDMEPETTPSLLDLAPPLDSPQAAEPASSASQVEQEGTALSDRDHAEETVPADSSGTPSPQADQAPGGPTESQPAASYGTRSKLVLYDIPDRFEGPKKYTLSLLGGLTRFDELDGIMASTNGAQSYFAYAPSFRFQLGRQFANQLQLQLELGVARYRGFALAEDGAVSGDVIEAKAYPGSISLSYRFDYAEEQAVVPYLGAGLSGVVGTFSDFEDTVTSSTSSDTSTDDSTSDTTTDTTDTSSDTAVTLGAIGTRFGAYLGFGFEFLLDVFEPERASDLELSSGINDSYFVLDIRYYWLDRYVEDATLKQDTDNVPYNGLEFTAGLKFDF